MEREEETIYKQMLLLCGPLVLANILQQFYNTIDAWMIGRYSGQSQFAAIGIAGTAMNLFLFFIVGLCTGIAVIFAQLYGAHDMRRFKLEHFQVLFAGTGFTVLLAGVGIAFIHLLLHALGTPDYLFRYTKDYLLIILLGLPFSFMYNFYNAMLRAVGNVKVPLLILFCAVLANLFMDFYLIKNLQMGIHGAAMATVFSQIFSVAASVCYLLMKKRELCFKKENMIFSWPLLRHTVSLSLVTGVHQASLYLGKMFIQGAVNSAGSEMITAYTTTTRIEGFINSFGDSGAAATSVIVAQSAGAKDLQRLRNAVKTSAVILTIFGLVCSLIMGLSSSLTVSFMLGKNQGPAFIQAKYYLQTISFFYLLCFWGNTFAGFFDGIGKSLIPFAGAVFHMTLRVIIAWILIKTIGLSAIAYACGIGWALADSFWLVMSTHYLKKGYLKNYVSQLKGENEYVSAKTC